MREKEHSSVHVGLNPKSICLPLCHSPLLYSHVSLHPSPHYLYTSIPPSSPPLLLLLHHLLRRSSTNSINPPMTMMTAAAPHSSADTSLTKVFVGGLAWETPKEAMKDHFEKYGDILEAVIISDKLTGRSKGYGFVSAVNFTDRLEFRSESQFLILSNFP